MAESKKFEKKVGKVMHEYKHGSLEFSAGHKVKNRQQAIAVALSEARRNEDK